MDNEVKKLLRAKVKTKALTCGVEYYDQIGIVIDVTKFNYPQMQMVKIKFNDGNVGSSYFTGNEFEFIVV